MDDGCIHVVGKSREANARTLERIAATAFRWADNNAVAFDDSKTELLHFHRARKDDISPLILVTLPNGTTVNPGTPNIGRDVVRWKCPCRCRGSDWSGAAGGLQRGLRLAAAIPLGL